MCEAVSSSQASSWEGHIPPISPASRSFCKLGSFSVPLAACQTLSVIVSALFASQLDVREKEG